MADIEESLYQTAYQALEAYFSDPSKVDKVQYTSTYKQLNQAKKLEIKAVINSFNESSSLKKSLDGIGNSALTEIETIVASNSLSAVTDQNYRNYLESLLRSTDNQSVQAVATANDNKLKVLSRLIDEQTTLHDSGGASTYDQAPSSKSVLGEMLQVSPANTTFVEYLSADSELMDLLRSPGSSFTVLCPDEDAFKEMGDYKFTDVHLRNCIGKEGKTYAQLKDAIKSSDITYSMNTLGTATLKFSLPADESYISVREASNMDISGRIYPETSDMDEAANGSVHLLSHVVILTASQEIEKQSANNSCWRVDQADDTIFTQDFKVHGNYNKIGTPSGDNGEVYSNGNGVHLLTKNGHTVFRTETDTGDVVRLHRPSVQQGQIAEGTQVFNFRDSSGNPRTTSLSLTQKCPTDK